MYLYREEFYDDCIKTDKIIMLNNNDKIRLDKV